MDKQAPDLLEIYKEFHEIMDKPGFQPLIRCASKIFGGPVIFTDDQYQLIAIYPTKKINDFVYDTLLTTGTLPEETIAAFHKAYLRKPGTRYQPFYEKEGLVKDSPRIFAEVYDEAKVIGHIAIFLKDKDFEPWHLEAASFLTSTLKIKINLARQAPSIYAESLHNLLDRKSARQVKARAITQLSKMCKKNVLLIVAPLDQSKSQHAISSIVINNLINRYPSSVPIVYHDDLVILLTEDKSHAFLASIAEQISEYLFQHKILCGAVSPIADFNLLPDNYLQGRLTALYRYQEELVNPDLHTPLYFYHQVAPHPLFLQLSQNRDYQCFIHPCLAEIKDYDAKNNTALYDTLAAYCKNLFQKNESAEALHVHRNTLNYRLGRIEELFGLDLNNYQTLLHLLISIEMSAY